MRHILTALLFLAVAGPTAMPMNAHAGEIDGDGWRIFLPDGFQTAPTSAGARLGSRVRKLVAATGISLSGGPTVRQFVRLGPGGEEATLMVLRYQLPTQTHVKSVDDLDLESVRRAVTLTAETNGDLDVQRIERSQFNQTLAGLRFLVVERGPTGEIGEFRFAMTISGGAAVVVAFRAHDWASFDVPEAWSKALASLVVTQPKPGIDRYFWLAGLVLGVALLGMTLVFLFRRMRDTGPPAAMVIDPSQRREVANDDDVFVDTGIREMDGLGTYAPPPGAGPQTRMPAPPPPPPGTTSAPGALPPPPPPAPPRPLRAPAASSIPGLTPELTSFDLELPTLPDEHGGDAPVRPQVDYHGGGPAGAPPASPRRPKKTPEAAPAGSDDGDEQNKPRFSRNDDFLD